MMLGRLSGIPRPEVSVSRFASPCQPNLQSPQKRPLLPCGASNNNGMSWGMAGKGRPGHSSSGSTANRLRADEPLFKGQDEDYKMQPAENSREVRLMNVLALTGRLGRGAH